MSAKTHLSGPNSYRIKLLSNLSLALAETVARRVRNGPLLPGWNWAVELTTEVLRRQLTTAFNLRDINEARRFLDSFELFPATPGQLRRTPVPTGEWFEVPQPAVTVLYFHGGGYTFYPRAYSYFLAHIAQAAHARLFALDYRLAPEHKFPAQLNDAIAAYTRLLAEGVSLNTLVIAGDSAGGHLALGCLLKLRELRLPLPALAVALSPPPDFQTEWPSFVQNARFDWIERPMLEKWADCFCSPGERADPLISLVKADFRSLCPIYIQCGEAEILRDSIQNFAKHANAKQANIIFESWPEMNHVFQIFGSYAPQSAAALSQIGKVIADTVLLKQNCVLPR